MSTERERVLERLRAVCLALPETRLIGIVEDAFPEVAPPKLVEVPKHAGP